MVGDPGLSDYTLKFKARSPQGCGQVQIWAGVRTANRFDRYVVGIKGGLQDDLYLMRTGYMGMDEFMGVRPLGFHPFPANGMMSKWKYAATVSGFSLTEKIYHVWISPTSTLRLPLAERPP